MPDADVRVGGRYRLGRQLAAGGMGAVWEGWDERLHRTIAIKRLHLEPWLSDAERQVGIQRAMREARLTARLHHPNVVQVFDVVDDADSPCLIMEYVPSRSLSDLVREHGPMSPDEVARIGGQVAAGLAAAHNAGIVHRDVKPGNVLIGRDGTAKVSDFGISHAFDDVTVTATGLLVGTPAFLAPEVARGGSPDFASDVYSFGSTLYMAVEGKAPFAGDDNPMAVLHQAASGQWAPPTRSGPLTDLLARMMALDPQARPSVRDVEQELQRISRGRSAVPTADTTQVIPARQHTSVAPPPSVADAPSRPADPRRKRSWLPLLVGLLAAALAAVIVIVLLSGTSGDGQPGGGQSAAAGGPGTVARTNDGHQRTTDRTSQSNESASSPPGTQPVANPPAGGAGATAQELADAITEYFQLVPGDLDAGWDRLTPHFQETRAQGRDTYDSYWNSVDHVDVTSVQGLPPDSATADLVYHYDDGRVVSQTSTFTLVREDGILKIDAES